MCLLGDFNPRVGKLQDYVIVDDYLANHNNWDEETREAVERGSIHSDIHYKLDRKPVDTASNNYGYKFTKFCQTTIFLLLIVELVRTNSHVKIVVQ